MKKQIYLDMTKRVLKIKVRHKILDQKIPIFSHATIFSEVCKLRQPLSAKNLLVTGLKNQFKLEQVL